MSGLAALFHFVWPWALALLPWPLLVRAVLPRAHPPDPDRALPAPFAARLRAASGARTRTRPARSAIVAWAAWAMAVLALSQPQWLGDITRMPSSGRDLMMVVDISGSMRQMDFTVDGRPADRLTALKRVAEAFIDGRSGDRIGLIPFGATAHLRAPLSHDRDAIKALLDETEIAMAGEYTAVGDALTLAVRHMDALGAERKVAILLTDGASNAGRVGPLQAAEIAAAHGVKVHTVGIGRQDVVAPNPFGVWSAEGAMNFEREILEAVAETTGGVFFHALDSDGLAAAYRAIDAMDPALGGEVWEHLGTPLYPWPLAGALLLSALLAAAQGRRP